MPRPRPPSRVDNLTFPVFGMSWFANPGDGTSIVAFCGGGGSARTGVNNFIIVQTPDSDEDSTLRISTGDHVGVALTIFQNPLSGNIWLVVAMGQSVQRYSLMNEGGEPAGEITLPGSAGCNALAVNSTATQLAVGCESGEVYLMQMEDEPTWRQQVLAVYKGHVKTVCAVAFSPRGDRLVSAAKDGTARVWDLQEDVLLSELVCTVEEEKAAPAPPAKKKTRPPQILVRGCAFGDLDGKLIFTVASERRGGAFLARWYESQPKQFECERTKCSPCPVSAMSVSGDGALIVLGCVDGSVLLWGAEEWVPLKKFAEIHDLPVTCCAARPYRVPLRGEEDGVEMHAISASADSQLAWLTLQTRVPRQPRRSGGGTSALGSFFFFLLNSLRWSAVILALLYPVLMDAQEKCMIEYNNGGLESLQACVLDDVLIAPVSRPGILKPPY